MPQSNTIESFKVKLVNSMVKSNKLLPWKTN